MVIGEDHIDPGRAGGGDLVDGRDPAVDRDQQVGPASRQTLDGRDRQAVTVVAAARQIPPRLGPQRPQRPDQHGGRADAVNVVVAVHDDPSAGIDVAPDQLDRRAHPLEGQRVVANARRQQLANLVGIAETATDEDLRENVADSELALERQRSGEVVGRELNPPQALIGRPNL